MAQSTDQSQLKIYSLGLVANNKAMSDEEGKPEFRIQVTPIESLSMLDGELASLPEDQEASGTDASGQSYSSKIKTDTAVEAKWLPGSSGTNRRTPPDVRRGERVLIWQYGDTTEFYWSSLGMDDHLRKLETAIYTWSGTTDEAVDGTQEGNCYSLEISTHTGQITLKTSKANNEHCVYGIQINAKEGNIKIVDDLDNEFVFDSAETNLWMKNADGTYLELNKEIINAYAPDAMNFEAKNSISFKTKDYSIACTNYKCTSTNFENACATGVFKGNYTFENQLTVSQAFKANGPAGFEQQIQAKGMRSTLPIIGPSDTI